MVELVVNLAFAMNIGVLLLVMLLVLEQMYRHHLHLLLHLLQMLFVLVMVFVIGETIKQENVIVTLVGMVLLVMLNVLLQFVFAKDFEIPNAILKVAVNV